MKQKTDARLLVGLVLICFCMRAPMSVVGPLVSQMKETLGLSSAFSGLLTTIPLLIFAAVAPFAGRVLPRIRTSVLFPLCIFAILAGVLIRSYCGLFGVLAGTTFLGLGIGILNVAIPVWIRETFSERVGPMMGIYSVAMTALSALAAGSCVWLSSVLSGWQNAMAIFALFPLIAFPVWLLRIPAASGIGANATPARFCATAKHAFAWCVALFMGIQSALFFALIAWLPSILAEHGCRGSTAGMMVLVFQLVSLITNYLMPVWFQKYPTRRKLLAVCCGIVYAAGFVLLIIGTAVGALVTGVVLLGLGSGLSLSFALTVIAMRGKNGSEAVSLSAFAQCIGYLLAAPAPMLLGSALDALGSFQWPLIGMVLLCVPMMISGILAVKRHRE